MPLPRIRDAVAFDPEHAVPRWPLLAFAAAAGIFALLGNWALAGDDAIVDVEEGLTWRP